MAPSAIIGDLRLITSPHFTQVWHLMYLALETVTTRQPHCQPQNDPAHSTLPLVTSPCPGARHAGRPISGRHSPDQALPRAPRGRHTAGQGPSLPRPEGRSRPAAAGDNRSSFCPFRPLEGYRIQDRGWPWEGDIGPRRNGRRPCELIPVCAGCPQCTWPGSYPTVSGGHPILGGATRGLPLIR